MSKISNTLKISRSGLKLILECPRCFWLDLHHKIKRPPGYPYTLSAAVDYLVKREFDKYRAKGILPPIFKDAGIKNAKLYNSPDLAEWRNNFKGISYFDEDLNAILYGAIDDVLEFSDARPNSLSGRDSLAVIDYKSSGSKEITIYDDYQKQMDIYTHILNRKGFETQSDAYFVFYKVDKTGDGFKNVLPFSEELKIVKVNPGWVSDAFERAIETARQSVPPISPAVGGHCDHCHYVGRVIEIQRLAPEDVNI